MHEDPLKRNIYHIQDSDRPMFVAATSYLEALKRWESVVAAENGLAPYELDQPQGVALIAEYDEVLI